MFLSISKVKNKIKIINADRFIFLWPTVKTVRDNEALLKFRYDFDQISWTLYSTYV